jgi:hypothetical protein
MTKTIDEIYNEASAFIDKNFPDLKQVSASNNRRITLLSVMKMLVELEDQKTRANLQQSLMEIKR